MVLSKRIRISQAQADDVVKTYFANHVTDMYESSAAVYGEFPDNFLTMDDMFRDYIHRGYRIEVTFDQFVRALKALRPRRCFVNKYGQIIIGQRLRKLEPVEPIEPEETTTVV